MTQQIQERKRRNSEHILAGLGIVNSFVRPVPAVAYIGVMITVVAILIWFGLESKRLYEKYWNDAKKNR